MDFTAVLAVALAANISGRAPLVLPHEALVAAAKTLRPDGGVYGKPWTLSCGRRLSEVPPGSGSQGCSLEIDGRSAEVAPADAVIERLIKVIPPTGPVYGVGGAVYLYPDRAEFFRASAARATADAITPPTRDAVGYVVLFADQSRFGALKQAAARHGSSSEAYDRIVRGYDEVQADLRELYDDVAPFSRAEVDARPEFAARLDAAVESLGRLLEDAGWTPEDTEVPEDEID